MPDAGSKPVAAAEGRDLGDEYLFYDRDGDRVHVLNRTAREILLLCDGKRTAEEVAAAFAGRYDVDDAKARSDAQAILDELVGLGLVRYE